MALVFPIAFFFFAIWLIFVRLRQSPLSEVEEYISQRDWKKAHNWVTIYLEEETLTRPKLLMYGSIARFGMEEAGLETKGIPDYPNQLQLEDSSKIFLKDMYIRTLELFAKSSRIMGILCDYHGNFGGQLDSLHVRAAVETDTIWEETNSVCRENLFSGKIQFLRDFLFVTTGRNLQLREEPNLSGSVLLKLDKGVRVLRRKKGLVLNLGGRSHHWYFVFTREGRQGWLYGRYLAKLKAEPSP